MTLWRNKYRHVLLPILVSQTSIYRLCAFNPHFSFLSVTDCTVSEWSDWSKCDASCGVGTRVRTRDVTREASNGGERCPDLEEQRSCRAKECVARRLEKISAHGGEMIMKPLVIIFVIGSIF